MAFPTGRPPDSKSDLEFPKTTCSLWDKTSKGPPAFLHIGYYRKPKVCVPEKILKIIQHQCENYGQTSHVLVGTLVVDEDGEGIQFLVDRLDTREHISADNSGLAPGDIVVPLEVTNNTAKDRCGSVKEYACALKRLQDRSRSRDAIDLSRFVMLRGWGSFYSNAHTSVSHLDFDMSTLKTVFQATPITPVPIVLTALSKNLAWPMSPSRTQGTTKSGFLTMDHTRKLLLVLESDPKSSSLPVVGIWVLGTEYVHHPFVWAACLRYIYCAHLQDRVCAPPESFLLVLYTPLHSRPEFYQCCPTTNGSDILFSLFSGHEVGNLTKSLSSQTDNFIEVELGPTDCVNKMEMFDCAIAEHVLSSSNIAHGTGSNSMPEDIEPRAAPTPHTDKVPVFRPMVPDVSILWTEPPDSLPMTVNSRQAQSDIVQAGGAVAAQTQSAGPRVNLSLVSGVHRFQTAAGPIEANTRMFHQRPNCSQVAPVSQTQAKPFSAQASTPGMFVSHQYQQHLPAYSPPVPNGHTFPFAGPSPANTRYYSPHAVTTQSTPPTHSMGDLLQPAIQTVQGKEISYPAFASSVASQEQLSHASVPAHQHPATIVQRSVPLNQAGSIAVRQTFQPRLPGQIVPPHQNKIAYPTYLRQPSQQQTPHIPSSIQSSKLKGMQLSHSQPQSESRGRSPYLPSNVMFTPAQVPEQFMAPGHALQPESLQPPVSQRLCHTPGTCHQQMASCSNAKEFHPAMTFLKTVVEESSSSSSSSSSSCDITRKSKNQSSADPNVVSDAGSRLESSGNNTSNSGRSSDDSGLSVTPERGNPSPHPQNQPLPVSSSASSVASGSETLSTASFDSEVSIENVKWEQVPPEIRTLLIQQNRQLKQLQQQIQMLMQNQSQPSTISTLCSTQQLDQRTSVHNSTVSSQDPRQCSVAAVHNASSSSQYAHHGSVEVNTVPSYESPVCVNNVGATCDSPSVQTAFHHEIEVSPVSPEVDDTIGDVAGPSTSGNTPAEIRHLSQVPVNSTAYEEQVPVLPVKTARDRPEDYGGMGNQSSPKDDLSQTDLLAEMENMPMYEHTMNTGVSDLVLDLPDYASSSMSRSQFDSSPKSVSACYNEDDSYSTLAEDATDPKQYYSQLMNNIQLFLTNDGSCDNDTSSANLESSIPPAASLKCPGSANTTLIPQIDYVSMMLGLGSDSSQSMEINAMAMKYLNDEQLTQMAKLQQMNRGTNWERSKYAAQILQKVTGGQKSSSDVSRLGMSPNDITMGTRKYLEKHGLLGNDTLSANSQVSFLDNSLKLNTDFSMAVSGGQSHNSDWHNSDDEGSSCDVSWKRSPSKCPAKKDIQGYENGSSTNAPIRVWSKSPKREMWQTQKTGQPQDLGASPILPSKKHSEQLSATDDMCYDNQVRKLNRTGKHRATNMKQHSEPSEQNNDSAATASYICEDENILDIEKLKQLPKLL